jgi:hypothetical protein
MLLQDEDDRAVADYERAIKALGEASPRAQMIKEEIASIKSRRSWLSGR